MLVAFMVNLMLINFSCSSWKVWFSSGSVDGVFMSLAFFILLIESAAHFTEYVCSLILSFKYFLLYTLGVDESSSEDDHVSIVKMSLLSSVVDSLMEVNSSKVSVLDEISITSFSSGLVFFSY